MITRGTPISAMINIVSNVLSVDEEFIIVRLLFKFDTDGINLGYIPTAANPIIEKSEKDENRNARLLFLEFKLTGTITSDTMSSSDSTQKNGECVIPSNKYLETNNEMMVMSKNDITNTI